MQIAIFSDVHGNLSALRAVLADIDACSDLDQVIFAGDLCLFGPRPQESLDLLRQRNFPAIVGNTDEWIRQPPPLLETMSGPDRAGRQQLIALCQWTEEQLDAPALAWLDQLRTEFSIRLAPSTEPDDALLIVHANPLDLLTIIFPAMDDQLARYGRIRQTDADLAPLLQAEPASTIAYGHLHIPGQRRWQGKNLFNISSVSLPGDGDPRAKYAILNWDAIGGWTTDFKRVPYPVDEEIEAYRDRRPPGWEKRVEQLTSLGYAPQVV